MSRTAEQSKKWREEHPGKNAEYSKRYIEKIKTHIQRIEPHEEKGIVNGENAQIYYVTKKSR